MESNRKKKVTMKDIADKLNLSINAVSLALNDRVGVSEDTRGLIIKTANELGYFDGASSYINKNTKNICLMIESRFFKEIPFYSKIILGVETESKKNNFDVITNFIDTAQFIIPACIENRKVSGILIVGSIKDEFVREIMRYNIPIVTVDHASQLISTDAILTQNITGAYMATQYLIDKGHKDIGFCGDINASMNFKERWVGFNESLRESQIYKGLPIANMSRFSITGPIENLVLNRNYSELAKIVSKLEELPSAWVCISDNTAISLFYALEILGIKVPKQASIIGFDDIDLCEIIRPHLTTIRVNKELMGEKAVKKLIWRINNPSQPFEKIGLEVTVIERESVMDLNPHL